MRVLIADDSSSIRMMLKKILTGYGYEVIVAENGRQAWDVLRKGDLRLAILDWEMPEMDGVDVCRKIQEKNGNSWVYVIMLTSRNGIENIVTTLEAGASDYLAKPFHENELLARLRVGERIVKLQIQIGHMQKMKSLGQLAAGIAHEINSPLQFLNSNIRFFRDSFARLSRILAHYRKLLHDADADQKMREELTCFAKSADEDEWEFLSREIAEAVEESLVGLEQVATIVRAMREFSRPGDKERQEVDLNGIIVNTITVASNEWKRVARLETDLDSTIPPVFCLPDQLSQVFLHLLTNAAHAVGEASTNAILPADTGVINIASRLRGEWVEVDIRDNGMGIPTAVADRVFDPFFTTKVVGQGTGQGLAIVHDIVINKHGGTISFSSDPGRGTTFTVRFPIGKQKQTSG